MFLRTECLIIDYDTANNAQLVPAIRLLVMQNNIHFGENNNSLQINGHRPSVLKLLANNGLRPTPRDEYDEWEFPCVARPKQCYGGGKEFFVLTPHPSMMQGFEEMVETFPDTGLSDRQPFPLRVLKTTNQFVRKGFLGPDPTDRKRERDDMAEHYRRTLPQEMDLYHGPVWNDGKVAVIVEYHYSLGCSCYTIGVKLLGLYDTVPEGWAAYKDFCPDWPFQHRIVSKWCWYSLRTVWDERNPKHKPPQPVPQRPSDDDIPF